jgi:hypothetical protein
MPRQTGYDPAPVLQCSYCFDLSLGLCRLAVLSRDTFRHTEFHMVKSIETLDIQRSRCKCLMCGVFVESSNVAHSFSIDVECFPSFVFPPCYISNKYFFIIFNNYKKNRRFTSIWYETSKCDGIDPQNGPATNWICVTVHPIDLDWLCVSFQVTHFPPWAVEF